MWSTRSWWEAPIRVELAEIMEDLEPGWATWREAVEPAYSE